MRVLEKKWNKKWNASRVLVVESQLTQERGRSGAPPPRAPWGAARAALNVEPRARARWEAQAAARRGCERPRMPRAGAMSGAGRTAIQHNHVAYAQPWTPCLSPHMLATCMRASQ
jgi:hypothetical protein